MFPSYVSKFTFTGSTDRQGLPYFKDDTIVVFMSDNGADLAKKTIYHLYNHDQSAFGTISYSLIHDTCYSFWFFILLKHLLNMKSK